MQPADKQHQQIAPQILRGNAEMRMPHKGLSMPAVPVYQQAIKSPSPVQLLKSHAETIAAKRKLKIDDITKEKVTKYVNDAGNHVEDRRALLLAWNKDQNRHNTIPIPDKLFPGSESMKFDGPFKPITRSDSYEDFGKMKVNYDFEGFPKEKLGTIGKKSTSDIPVVTDVASAIRLVRAYGVDSLTKSLIGPQFILRLGNHEGLFDSPRGNDLVYIPLKGTDKGNIRMRMGGIFDWSSHATELDRHFPKQMAEVKQSISDTINGKSVPESDLIMSTVGAMICDAKRSVTGFLEFLNIFIKSEETNALKLFNSDPKQNPVWGPSQFGGRSMVDEKRQEVFERGYMPDQQQQDVLEQRGLRAQWIEPDGRCIFGAISLFHGSPVTEIIDRVLNSLRYGLTNDMRNYLEHSHLTAQDVIDCIKAGDWASDAGDAVPAMVAFSLGMSISILLPGGNIQNINGSGGPLLIKVVNPLEHYHATRKRN